MKLTATEYVSLFRRLVDSAGIFSLRPTENDHVFERMANELVGGHCRLRHYINFESAWAANVSITVTILLNSETLKRCEPRVVAKIGCELGWSATTRDIANATAAIALYSKALALAAQIEATFADVQIDGLNPADYRAAE